MKQRDFRSEVGNLVVTLTFEEAFSYADDRGGEIVVPVVLKIGEQAVSLFAKLDTGAQHCIVQREFGEALGLDIETGDRMVFTTAAGTFVAYGHPVTVECFGREFDSTFYFAEQLNFSRNVLGRNGWLEQFRVAIVHYDRNLFASPYNE